MIIGNRKKEKKKIVLSLQIDDKKLKTKEREKTKQTYGLKEYGVRTGSNQIKLEERGRTTKRNFVSEDKVRNKIPLST